MSNNILNEISNNQLIQQVDTNIEQQLIISEVISEVISDINIENIRNELDIYPPYVTRQNAFCTSIEYVNMVNF